ncbi:MAG: hypothetical protein ACK5XZ_13205 [Hyphomonadaceae bacterium]|jgi:hypothetical protein|uniref:hypothetical protein n=1 Tax=Aquidulcibacter sp. TaxID=2052990 RepID=UPI0022BC5538|nr:hypothetical protein [Aquidulcibacter sp.]MCE2890826.1 hypothetical protein [Hyphomonadaceae bacterium]MCZ8209100.1 hypothetical protein [Aquidulcibacter sp.]
MFTQISWGALLLVHLIPALALFQPGLITKLYRVEAASPLFLLFQHRAALFLVVCMICAWSIVRPEVRQLATVAVGFSMLSFLWLFWAAGSPPSLRSIALVDLIGLPLLAFVAWQAFKPLG